MSFATPSRFILLPIRCSDSNSSPKRGFGPNGNKTNKGKKTKGLAIEQRKSATRRSRPDPSQAPGLSSQFGEKSNNTPVYLDFDERVKAVKRSALEQKKAKEEKEFGAIDYDAPIESEKKTIGLGTKIGVGVAVAVFGLVFAFGDFLPSSVGPSEDAAVVDNQLSEEEKTTLQTQLKEYEAMLSNSPKDPTALEGAAVTLAEFGEYTRAASLLQDLTKEKPSDPDVFRLLGEVKYKLRNYEGSADAYKTSTEVSKNLDFEVLRGCTNALLAAKKPDEAIRFLLASRERLSKENSDAKTESSTGGTQLQKMDPIQVDLLLGKAYSEWGHIRDAVSVYDQLISSHPEDFRGYLAKKLNDREIEDLNSLLHVLQYFALSQCRGIILKENGNVGDAERMFIQAWFFAPEKAKALVDRYSRK